MLRYEGAKKSYMTQGWRTTSNSQDAEAVPVLFTLRDRARYLVRNNPYAARAVEVRVANTIGTGIIAEVENSRLTQLWAQFVNECDADGKLDFNGIQALVERSRVESGEVLVRRVPSRGGLGWQIRVLEADHFDMSKDGQLDSGGGWIQHGIEYDRFGDIAAYHLYREHPGDSSVAAAILKARGVESERVPAADVIHLFRRLRPGQTRGVTEFAPVMLRMQFVDDYDTADLVAKRLQACLAVFVRSPLGPTAANLAPLGTDSQGTTQRLSPGLIQNLRPGEDISVIEPKAMTGYGDFQRVNLRAIASGMGIPYELMTGDLSQVNYSSYRAGLIDFRRRIEQDQWQMYVPQFCERVWNWFLEEARVLSSSEGLGNRTRPAWSPPRFELVDPLKETQAEIEACLAGFESWDEIVRRRGYTSEEQLRVIAEWNEKLDELGIKLKSDHRTAIKETAADAGNDETPPDDETQPNEGQEAA